MISLVGKPDMARRVLEEGLSFHLSVLPSVRQFSQLAHLVFLKLMIFMKKNDWYKTKVLMVLQHSTKLHAWEKSGSHIMAKNDSRSMRFQYSLIVNILLID